MKRRVVFKCSSCGKEIYEEDVPFTFYEGKPMCMDCYIKMKKIHVAEKRS